MDSGTGGAGLLGRGGAVGRRGRVGRGCVGPQGRSLVLRPCGPLAAVSPGAGVSRAVAGLAVALVPKRVEPGGGGPGAGAGQFSQERGSGPPYIARNYRGRRRAFVCVVTSIEEL